MFSLILGRQSPHQKYQFRKPKPLHYEANFLSKENKTFLIIKTLGAEWRLCTRTCIAEESEKISELWLSHPQERLPEGQWARRGWRMALGDNFKALDNRTKPWLWGGRHIERTRDQYWENDQHQGASWGTSHRLRASAFLSRAIWTTITWKKPHEPLFPLLSGGVLSPTLTISVGFSS